MYENIKRICNDKKIPMSKVEKDLGFGKGYISKLVTSSPSVNNAVKIAEYLNVPLKELIKK